MGWRIGWDTVSKARPWILEVVFFFLVDFLDEYQGMSTLVVLLKFETSIVGWKIAVFAWGPWGLWSWWWCNGRQGGPESGERRENGESEVFFFSFILSTSRLIDMAWPYVHTTVVIMILITRAKQGLFFFCRWLQ